MTEPRFFQVQAGELAGGVRLCRPCGYVDFTWDATGGGD